MLEYAMLIATFRLFGMIFFVTMPGRCSVNWQMTSEGKRIKFGYCSDDDDDIVVLGRAD